MATAYLKIGRGSEDGSDRKSGQIPVVVTGAATEAAARAAVVAKLAAEGLTTYDGNTLANIALEELEEGSQAWQGEAQFESPTFGPVEAGEETEDFSTMGATAHINISKNTRGAYSTNGLLTGDGAKPFSQAIGYDNSGNIAGTDIIVPTFERRFRRVLTDAQVTDAYMDVLFGRTGTMNNGTFRGLEPGENLFKGAEGGQRGDGKWDLTYYTAGSPNVTTAQPFTIKGGGPDGDLEITVTDKRGWDYLWVFYISRTDTTNKIIVPRPLIAVVEQVYEETSHDGILI